MQLIRNFKADSKVINNFKTQVVNIKIPYMRAATLLLILYLAFITIPGMQLSPVNIGLDSSWVYAINFLPNSHYLFGRDVVWTFGPLGYILNPLDIGNNTIISTIFWNALYFLFYAGLIYLVFRQKKLLNLLLFVLACILSWLIMLVSFAGLFYANQYLLMLLIGLLLCLSALDDMKILYIPVFLAGILSGLALFMKLNIGLSAVSMVVIYTIYTRLKYKRQNWKSISIVWAGFLISIIVVEVFYFHSFGNLAHWVRASIDIISGYSAAMSYGTIQLPLLVVALFAIAIYIISIILFLRKKSVLVYVGLLFIIPVILAFKESFVRQDAGHLIYFFFFLPIAISGMFIFAREKKELLWVYHIFMVGLIPVLAFVLIYAFIDNHSMNQSYQSSLSNIISKGNTFITGKTGWSNLYSLTQIKEIREQTSYQSQHNLANDRLPAAWVSIIGNSTVGVVPWEISYMPANSLNWDPDPVLQMYSEYTPFLDNWSASHYAGDNSPQFLIVAFENIDGRHPLMDAPAAWRSILTNYKVIDNDQAANIFLLQRKPVGEVNDDLVNTKQVDAKIGQWVEVPPCNNLLYAEINMHTNLKGKLAGTFYLIPPTNIDVIYSSGKEASWRIIPATLSDGVLLNYLPSSSEELSSLFSGNANDTVEWFKISGPGTSYYFNNIDITWMESTNSINYTNEEINPQMLALMTGNTLYSIDSVDNLQPAKQNFTFTIDTQKTRIVTISGWAVDQKADNAAGGVFINIDGKRDIPAFYGIDRSDVANYFKNINYTYSGFSSSIPISDFNSGNNVISLKIINNDKNGYYEPQQKIILNVN